MTSLEKRKHCARVFWALLIFFILSYVITISELIDIICDSVITITGIEVVLGLPTLLFILIGWMLLFLHREYSKGIWRS